MEANELDRASYQQSTLNITGASDEAQKNQSSRRNESSYEEGGAEKKRRHKRTQTSEASANGEFVNLDGTNLRQTNASTIEYLKRTPFYDEANPPMATNNPHFFRKERVQTNSAQE